MSGEKKGSPILARCGVYPEGIRALSPGLPRASAGRAGLPWVNAAMRVIHPERVLAPPVRDFAPNLCRVDIDLGAPTQGSSRTRNPGLSASYPFRIDRIGFRPANPALVRWRRTCPSRRFASRPTFVRGPEGVYPAGLSGANPGLFAGQRPLSRRDLSTQPRVASRRATLGPLAPENVLTLKRFEHGVRCNPCRVEAPSGAPTQGSSLN